MSVTITEVKTKKDLKKFVCFPIRLYGKHPTWVPPLIMDEMELFNPAKNPSFEKAESRQFLAWRDGTIVGRVAAILSHAANQKNGSKNMRFGWLDTEDDLEVASALMDQVEAWTRERGLETITGPHGFCDFDPNGMMVEGFQELATMSGNYNHPYQPVLMEKLGYGKEIDYVEFKSFPPYGTGIPDKLVHLAERIAQRGKFKLIQFKDKKHVLSRAPEIFHLLDDVYEDIYGAVPLTERQVNYYIKKYIPYVNTNLIKAVVNEKDEIVGFMITMPSLSKALQKARGRLFPLGVLHILLALRKHEVIDFLLAGIRKDCRGMGIDLLMMMDIAQDVMRMGFVQAESNQELETNTKIQAQWKFFNPVQHKRRRIFKKRVAPTAG